VKKIYFACSISGGRDHAHVYQDIVGFIKASGAQVLSELFADASLTSEFGSDPGITPAFIWKRDTDWVHEADAIIAEVTQPSLGVGYEIGKAHGWNKPVLALYYQQPGHRLSPMIAGSPNVTVFSYSHVSETESPIKQFLHKF
jgi:nucleoside 2-deoxyribosyltransferase